MKIGIDACCWSNQRGYGRFTRQLFKALINIESSHSFIFFCDPLSASQFHLSDGRHIKIVVSVNQSVSNAASSSGFRSPIDIMKMSRAVMRETLDYFFFPSTYSYFPILNRCRIGITIHDTIAELFPDKIFPSYRARLFWNLKTRMAIKQADDVFTVSSFARSCIDRIFKIPDEVITILPEAPDPFFYGQISVEEVLAAYEKFSLKNDDPFFLYVGGISPHKNIGKLISAFENEEFAQCRLLIVGEYENDPFFSDFDNLKTRLNDSPAKERILMPGYLSDSELRVLMKHAVALVLPSLHEGFGLPAAEAMASGAAVVTTRNSAIPEIAPDGAIQIDPENEASIADAMKKLLHDRKLREQIATSGHKAVKKLSWNSTAAKLLETVTAKAAR